MLKRIVLLMCITMILTGCYKAPDEGYIPYIEDFGPNKSECHSFYHYSPDKHMYRHPGLVRYDLITGTEQDIYMVEDPDMQSVTSYYGDDEDVYYVVTTTSKKSEESTLFHYDLKTGTCEDIITTEDDIYVYKAKEEKKIKVSTSTQSYNIENGSLQYAGDSTFVTGYLYSNDSSVKVISDNGTTVEIYKEYDNKEFICIVDGVPHTISALSSCGGEKSGVSNFFVVEGDKLIGVVQITRGGSGYGRTGIISCNILESKKLKKEVLVSVDLKTGESEILYNTKNNKTRIIGYSNGKAYLYKKGTIICKNLLDGSEDEIYSLSYEGDGQLSFSWVGSTLVIFDEKNFQVVASIQI